MTQWLIEEAAFLALEVQEAHELAAASPEKRAEQELTERHSEMVALRERMRK